MYQFATCANLAILSDLGIDLFRSILRSILDFITANEKKLLWKKYDLFDYFLLVF